VTLEEGARLVAGEAAVEPDQEEGGMGGEVRGEALQRVAVLGVGRHHPRAERIACVSIISTRFLPLTFLWAS
jgi:hypothetical protein